MEYLENRVCELALCLIESLSECNNEEFINTICSAIINADYDTINKLQDSAYLDPQEESTWKEIFGEVN